MHTSFLLQKLHEYERQMSFFQQLEDLIATTSGEMAQLKNYLSITFGERIYHDVTLTFKERDDLLFKIINIYPDLNNELYYALRSCNYTPKWQRMKLNDDDPLSRRIIVNIYQQILEEKQSEYEITYKLKCVDTFEKVERSKYKEEQIRRVVFRGDDRDPNKIFISGFLPKEHEANLCARVTMPYETKNLVACTIDLNVAAYFPINEKKYIDEITYIYVIALEQGFNTCGYSYQQVSQANVIGGYANMSFAREISTEKVLPVQILAALKIKRTNLNPKPVDNKSLFGNDPRRSSSVEARWPLGKFNITDIIYNQVALQSLATSPNPIIIEATLKKIMNKFMLDNNAGLPYATLIPNSASDFEPLSPLYAGNKP